MTGSGGSHDFGGANPIHGDGPFEGSVPPRGHQPPPGYQPQAPAGPRPVVPQYPQGAPPWTGPAGSFPAGAQPSKARPRRIVLIAAAVVIAVVAVVIGFVVFTGGSFVTAGSRNPEGAVTGYLQALSDGDAEKALTYVLEPPTDKTFLTDDILRKQAEKQPITDVQVVDSANGTVHIVANVGDDAIDETFRVSQAPDGAWKLNGGTYTLDFNKDKSAAGTALIDSVTLFGQRLPESGIATLFPGWLDIGNANQNVTTELQQQDTSLSAINAGGQHNANFDFVLTEAGKTAVEQAVLGVLRECAKSRLLSPPDCPQNASPGNFADGTVQWTAPTSAPDLPLETIGADGKVELYGTAEFTLGGPLVGTDAVISNPHTVWVVGTADISKDPPVIAIRKG